MIRLKDYTLTSMLEAAAARFGRLTALNTWRADDALSYTQLLQLSVNVAFYLHREGLGKNDKVAIIGQSCPNWGLSYLAVNRAGGIAVPVLPDFSAHEVRSILEHSEARFVVVNAANAAKLEGCDVKVIRMEDMAAVPVSACTDAKAFRNASGTDTRIVIPSDADRAELEGLRPSEDDIASIIYTSGTTGTPKAVMLTNRNIVFNAYECSTPFIKIHPGWNALSILPMSHVYEFTIGFVLLLINGVQITYLGKAPSTDTLLPAMKEVRPQVMLSVPLLIEKIYRRALLPKLKEGTRLGNLARNRFTAPLVYRIIGSKVRKLFGGRIRFFGVGGAAFDSEAEAFFHRIRFPYALGYGLTETAPFIAGCGPKDQVPGTLGPVLESLDVRLDSDTGEVLVKGPSVMKGYYKNSDLTSEVFTQDGYFRTGDIGEFADGRLRIKGRCKTMILGPSGENIYPENIEFLINSEEDVIESLVVADQGGLTAMIRLDMKALKKKGIVAIEAIQSKLDAIISGVNGKLSAFSRVRKAEIRELPFERTPTDKIKRFLYQKKA
ncbi:MAG: AMP-binding protein [bacterium]|jgi:long-chain acyl-CoA synthetase|nr:AMP-binding protein [bacterium]